MGRGPLIERHPCGRLFMSSACASARIGHYPEFPRVIPVSKKGYPRVTHPSAVPTIPLRGLRHSTCNVLGTPSAFILSQDQTLRSEKHVFITIGRPRAAGKVIAFRFGVLVGSKCSLSCSELETRIPNREPAHTSRNAGWVRASVGYPYILFKERSNSANQRQAKSPPRVSTPYLSLAGAKLLSSACRVFAFIAGSR